MRGKKTELRKAPPKQTKREASQTRDAFGKKKGVGGRTPIQQASFLERKIKRMKANGEGNTPEFKKLQKQQREIVKTFNLSPTVGGSWKTKYARKGTFNRNK